MTFILPATVSVLPRVLSFKSYRPCEGLQIFTRYGSNDLKIQIPDPRGYRDYVDA